METYNPKKIIFLFVFVISGILDLSAQVNGGTSVVLMIANPDNLAILQILEPWQKSLIVFISCFFVLSISVFVFWKVGNEITDRKRSRSKLSVEKHCEGMLYNNKELEYKTMCLVQKNRILMEIKDEIIQIMESEKADNEISRLSQLIDKIDDSIEDENTQKSIEIIFDQVHENFFLGLTQKYPELTTKDLRLCAYLKLGLTSKEIAPLLNISLRGVEISRYRLRKKLQLDHNQSLAEYFLTF